MSIRLDRVFLKKSVLVSISIMFSVWLGVQAETDAIKSIAEQGMPVIYGETAELAFCGPMISRVILLEGAFEKNICSKDGNYAAPKETVRRMRVVLTAYSSTVSQTDSTPFITANGTYVSDGIVANNGLPFGTEIRIPELFGGKVFSVQDRMHWRKSDYQFDIWFPTYEQAKSFGVKYAYVEILKK
jgi:3D (Asp-Asp-Asp) domain-containing protein